MSAEYIVEKIGMSRTVGVPSNAVTLVRVLDTKVCEVVSEGRGLVSYARGKKTNKAVAGIQNKYSLSAEFNRIATINVNNSEAGELDLTPLKEASEVNNAVKTTFVSKGRGFAGVMKRWNFAGGPGAHGSRFHRRVGSIGMCEWPGRVMPGKKMPGHYGNKTVSVKNEIISFDENSGVVVLKGSVGGANGSLGRIKLI
jgi:large subunit ribosomal protein L3